MGGGWSMDIQTCQQVLVQQHLWPSPLYPLGMGECSTGDQHQISREVIMQPKGWLLIKNEFQRVYLIVRLEIHSAVWLLFHKSSNQGAEAEPSGLLLSSLCLSSAWHEFWIWNIFNKLLGWYLYWGKNCILFLLTNKCENFAICVNISWT